MQLRWSLVNARKKKVGKIAQRVASPSETTSDAEVVHGTIVRILRPSTRPASVGTGNLDIGKFTRWLTIDCSIRM